MRLAHHLLRHPSGMWHFRLIVPLALQALIGRKVIKQSLRTRDPIIAKAWAYALGARYAQAFGKAREMGMPGPRHSGFEIQFNGDDDEEFSFKSIKTDNTPGDNAAVIEAIRLLAELRQAKALTSTPATATAAPALLPKRQIQIAKATEAWLIAIKGDTLKKTLTIKAAAVKGFAQHFGATKMLHEVQREDVHAWVEALRTSGLQTPTLVNKCSYLRGFLDWAMRAGYVPKFAADENPAVGHVIFRTREKQKRRALGFKAFTTEQVQLLYSPGALATLSEGARWGAVIGLLARAQN
jgi:hypothetical protein